ncbi:MAG: asparaginase [Mycetocola sp.]
MPPRSRRCTRRSPSRRSRKRRRALRRPHRVPRGRRSSASGSTCSGRPRVKGSSMARVHILATGGTIAGTAGSPVDLGYHSAGLGVSALVDGVQGLRSVATLTGEQFSQVGSQDMDDDLWLKLAARVNALFSADEADGIVITHGTDTAEETGFFLHLVVKYERPVVLTGSMRPATALSPDGPLNLFNAVSVAADPQARGRGAIVAINDDLHSARDVTKSSTTDVQTFVSPGPGLLGTASYGRIRYFRYPTHPHTTDSEFSVNGEIVLPRVDIVYAHANMPADLVRASAALGARGLVVAGVGNGNVSTEVAQALAEIAGSGVIVVRSSRVGSGDVGRNIEMDDDQLGLVASDQLNPQKSRVLLQLCLARGLQRDAVQDAFYRY